MKKETPVISVKTDGKGPSLGNFYGLFFEDINHAADGGLYAQMVQNPSFEFDAADNAEYCHTTAWKAFGGAELACKDRGGLLEKNPWWCQIAAEAAEGGALNSGFGGMYLEKGKEYVLSFFAKGALKIAVALENQEREALARAELTLADNWERYELTLTPSGETVKGCLSFTLLEPGRVGLDAVTLLPAGEGIFRADLLAALKELKPGFLRFPGGCLVHDGSLDPEARDSCYCWKNTLGAPEARPARRNNWGYNQTLGLGYYEYFLLCEELGCEPVPVLPAGYNPHRGEACPEYGMGRWIEDALDLIEFANGSAGTVWGKVRSELGHPAPFKLKYLAIGNEEVGEEFPPRFEMIAKAVKEKYPRIKLIHSAGPFPSGSEYERGWAAARKVGAELIDEHYYTSPQWMLANVDRYAKYSSRRPKVFVGEYASWGNTMFNAAAEAAYMTGLENSAHAVAMACYAPLLCNVEYKNWTPDLIYFDNHRVLRTLNYHVQKLFAENRPDYILPFETSGLGTAETVRLPILGLAEIVSRGVEGRVSDARVVNLDNGDTVSLGSFDLGPDAEHALSDINLPNCEIRFRFVKTGGRWDKGIVLNFGKKDEKNLLYWDIGGWQNQDSAISSVIDGRGTCLNQHIFTLEGGREYELCLRIEGRRVTALVDGAVMNSCEDRQPELRDLYLTAGMIKDGGQVVIKAVNAGEEKRRAKIDLGGGRWEGTATVLTAGRDEENTFDKEIAPTTSELNAARGAVTLDFPPMSVSVIRLRK